MNGTPRIRSAYPSTPHSERQDRRQGEVEDAGSKGTTGPLRSSTAPRAEEESRPLIPFSILDAPTQRFYISAFYMGLIAWRFFDYYKIVAEDYDAWPYFAKWFLIDAVFLFGLPELKIPWLEWSSSTMVIVYALHTVANAMLMFRVSLPFETGLLALTRMFFDGELAVAERRVKAGSILQNSSLILGKQIVHILPEGSAILNPDHLPFCIDPKNTPVELPIMINQTTPILIELLRLDLDSNTNETITISGKEARKLKKQAEKDLAKNHATNPRVLRYPVKQTGLYRLKKVVDVSNLEVQRTKSDTLVVSCPSARIEGASKDKCRGELSDVHFHVEGTPPLKVRYSKKVNKEDKSDVFLTVHPMDFESPLLQQQNLDSLVKIDGARPDITWAARHLVKVPINETLATRGHWEYSIDELHDAVGNVVHYSEHRSGQLTAASSPHQVIKVHDPPAVLLEGCSTQQPLKIAKGDSTSLPIWLNPSRRQEMAPLPHRISYTFIPGSNDDIEVEQIVQTQAITLKQGERGPRIQEPGLYSLTSVSNQFCTGQVMEPSSCLLLNAPEPEIAITSEAIPHQCAGNSIGLRLNLDMIGTPPFHISYTSRRNGAGISSHVEKIDSLRTQLEFKPRNSGRYTYEFLGISDAVYEDISLKPKSLIFETDVKPTAWGRFAQQAPNLEACVDEQASLEVILTGEAPYILEYDIVHGGKRKRYKETGIATISFLITTPKLNKGGQHTLSLTSVTDASGCKIFLEEEANIHVRHQRPGAAFGLVEGQRSLLILQGKKALLPLRLSGEPPYSITYSRLNQHETFRRTLRNVNDVLEVDSEDVYRLEEVRDSFCPGTIETAANQFEVRWIPRPSLRVVENNSVVKSDQVLEKLAVCQGDQDSVELAFTGNAPYHLEYDVRSDPDLGSVSVHHRVEDVALHGTSIRMDTSQAGWNEYTFSKLGDRSYDPASGSFNPISLKQRIHARPSAKFTNTGKIYSYCKEQTSIKDVVPISIIGQPPFALELGIRHHSSTAPEIVNIPNIHANNYDFHIPHRALSLGSHSLTIRKIRDGNGCESNLEPRGSVVRVNVVDVPTISPLETHADYCVGDRISFNLAGTPPFNVFYEFNGIEKKASSTSTTFRRLAEKPGNFTVTGVSDKASGDNCQARSLITKVIRPLPSVRISSGKVSEVDIHEGGEAELLFEFEGTPPFEFTFTRSTTATKGKRSVILETKSDVSAEHRKTVKVSEEGTYEVVSVRDAHCGVTAQGVQGRTDQKLLAFR